MFLLYFGAKVCRKIGFLAGDYGFFLNIAYVYKA
jgi:hypothetical protein